MLKPSFIHRCNPCGLLFRRSQPLEPINVPDVISPHGCFHSSIPSPIPTYDSDSFIRRPIRIPIYPSSHSFRPLIIPSTSPTSGFFSKDEFVLTRSTFDVPSSIVQRSNPHSSRPVLKFTPDQTHGANYVTRCKAKLMDQRSKTSDKSQYGHGTAQERGHGMGMG